MELKTYTDLFANEAQKKLDWLHAELGKIRSGRASPKMLDGVRAECYGEMTPLAQVAQIMVPEPRELTVKPFDPSNLNPILAALSRPELRLNPQADGDKIRIKLPTLTAENRKEYVKQAKQTVEKARQELRSVRRDVLQKIVRDKPENEDQQRYFEGEVEKLTKQWNEKLDAVFAAKERELTTL